MKKYNGSGNLAIWKLTQLSQSFVAARRHETPRSEWGRAAWLSTASSSHQDPGSQVQGKDGWAQLGATHGGLVSQLRTPGWQTLIFKGITNEPAQTSSRRKCYYNLLVSEKICPLPWRVPTTHLPSKGCLVQYTLAAAVYGVAQSGTRLKWLSSSSSSRIFQVWIPALLIISSFKSLDLEQVASVSLPLFPIYEAIIVPAS